MAGGWQSIGASVLVESGQEVADAGPGLRWWARDIGVGLRSGAGVESRERLDASSRLFDKLGLEGPKSSGRLKGLETNLSSLTPAMR